MIQNVGAFTRNTEFSLLPLQSISVSAIYGAAVFQALFPCVGLPLACIALLIWHTPSLCMHVLIVHSLYCSAGVQKAAAWLH